jgi:hypothetical protein
MSEFRSKTLDYQTHNIGLILFRDAGQNIYYPNLGERFRLLSITLRYFQTRVRVTLRLAVYRHSVRLGVKTFDIHDKNFRAFLQLNPSAHSPYMTYYLTRRCVSY